MSCSPAVQAVFAFVFFLENRWKVSPFSLCISCCFVSKKVALEDLQSASRFLRKALRLREKYMDFAHQSFPNVTRRFIHPAAYPLGNQDTSSIHSSQGEGMS